MSVTSDARPARRVRGASRRRVTSTTGGNSSAVERQPSKLGVAGSNPVSRSRPCEPEDVLGGVRAAARPGGWGPRV